MQINQQDNTPLLQVTIQCGLVLHHQAQFQAKSEFTDWRYKMKITDYNIDGTSVTRDMDDAELAQYEAHSKLAAAFAEQEANIADAKAALLERLGITEDEAKLLLS